MSETSSDQSKPSSDNLEWRGDSWFDSASSVSYQVPVRTFWIKVTNLRVLYGASTLFRREERLGPLAKRVTGECVQNARQSVSVIGNPSVAITRFAVTIDNREADQGHTNGLAETDEGTSNATTQIENLTSNGHRSTYDDYVKAAIAGGQPTGILGSFKADRELGRKDEWYIQANLPPDVFNALSNAIEESSALNLTLAFRFINIFVTDYHAPPAWEVRWYVPPPKNEYELADLVRGYVTHVSWFRLEDKVATTYENAETYQNAEQTRKTWVDNLVGQWFEDRNPKHGAYSEYKYALDIISKAALKHAEMIHAPVSGGNCSFEKLCDQGFAVVRNLEYGIWDSQSEDDKKALKLWSHRKWPVYDVQNKKSPFLRREHIEEAVGEYLELPYRARGMDRLLVDLLVALELYQYSNEMINEVVTPGLPPRSPLKVRHPLVSYLKGLLINFSLFILVGFILYKSHGLDDSWVWLSYIACAVLSLFWPVLATISLPFKWRAHRNAVKRVGLLIAEMQNCYRELESAGPISARHILERLRVADDKGVSWPPSLYALLDDVMQRAGRF